MRIRILALTLTLLLILPLTACGIPLDRAVDPVDNDEFTGVWKAEVNLEPYFTHVTVEENEDLENYVSFPELKVTMCLEFREDNTFSAYPDETSVRIMTAAVRKSLKTSLYNYILDQLRYYNVSMTVGEYLTSEGETLDSLTDAFNHQQIADDFIENFSVTGRFIALNGDLFFSTDPEQPVAFDLCDRYFLVDESLKLEYPLLPPAEEITDEEAAEPTEADEILLKAFSPIVFQRQTEPESTEGN